ncbi:MAG: DUF433 domain-containing protein [Planctomycetes bacterium]|nr:DUF433 domain-containing protein [Planctomycetota bacterium]
MTDVREQPAYSVAEAAAYLHIPKATLRSWLLGTTYGKGLKKRDFSPVIRPAQTEGQVLLSFFNLVEAHVLSAIRRTHKIPLQQVRPIVERLRKKSGSPRPLATERLSAIGKELFRDAPGEELVSLTHEDQRAMRLILDAYIQRIDRDDHYLPVKLYPFAKVNGYTVTDDRRAVVINPRVAYGKPVLVGTAIRADVLRERWDAGEDIAEIAEDYGRNQAEVEAALRFITASPAA